MIRFYPSPEFLDAGKFKLLRETLRDKGTCEYASYYAKKMGKSDEAAPAEVETPISVT
jgi:hypothetical protein